jgi:hypothetical protein
MSANSTTALLLSLFAIGARDRTDLMLFRMTAGLPFTVEPAGVDAGSLSTAGKAA